MLLGMSRFAITAGGASNEDEKSGPGENRYLFITAGFDPKLVEEPDGSLTLLTRRR